MFPVDRFSSLVQFSRSKISQSLEWRSLLIIVTAAVIEKNGKILIARRKAGSRLGGLWEFPGGKQEADENPKECLRRELHEEFGIDTEIGEFLISHIHEYPHGTIKLLSYRVHHLEGKFDLRDHEEVAWVEPKEFGRYEFAPADLPTIKFISDQYRG